MTRTAVYAQDMLHAQGYQLTAEHRAELVAKADRLREILGETGKQEISVPVRDIYQNTVLIGWLTYSM